MKYIIKYWKWIFILLISLMMIIIKGLELKESLVIGYLIGWYGSILWDYITEKINKN